MQKGLRRVVVILGPSVKNDFVLKRQVVGAGWQPSRD